MAFCILSSSSTTPLSRTQVPFPHPTPSNLGGGNQSKQHSSLGMKISQAVLRAPLLHPQTKVLPWPESYSSKYSCASLFRCPGFSLRQRRTRPQPLLLLPPLLCCFRGTTGNPNPSPWRARFQPICASWLTRQPLLSLENNPF